MPAPDVFAYGPVPGVELIPYFLALLAWIGLALAALVRSPVRAVVRLIRRPRAEPAAPTAAPVAAAAPPPEPPVDAPRTAG